MWKPGQAQYLVVNLAVVSKNKKNCFCLPWLIRSLLFNRWKTKLITSCRVQVVRQACLAGIQTLKGSRNGRGQVPLLFTSGIPSTLTPIRLGLKRIPCFYPCPTGQRAQCLCTSTAAQSRPSRIYIACSEQEKSLIFLSRKCCNTSHN